jgi:hypothetical protein
MVQNVLQEVAASISDANNDGDTIRNLLALQDADPIALASLLKIMHGHAG